MTVPNLLNRVRQPEYTGENRCLPCTVLNVGIAVVLTLVVAASVGYAVGATTAAIVGAVTLLSALATIGLRGYLVPGTPRLTERYLPERLQRRFHERPPGVDDDADIDLAMKGVGARGLGDDAETDDRDVRE